MNEKLLQFLWQHSLYNTVGLRTISGEDLVVIHPGRLNRDSGPDFSEARVKVGATTLVGNVEIHVRSSDWIKHGHDDDPAYKNLVLHVVFENDIDHAPVNTPVLVLSHAITDSIIAKYSDLVNTDMQLPCAGRHQVVKTITKEGWLSRLLAERWEQKLGEWNVLLNNSADDWRNLLYWRLAANFGFKTNATPFLLLAQSLPINIPTRHKDDLMQLEALFFGQAGMLDEDFTDDYPRQLQKEYDYLRKKYSLKPVNKALWKFMRMRPANFPTVRIAQFAALVQRSVHLFSQIIETHSVKEILPLLDVKASEYWDAHFRFDSVAEHGASKALGRTSIENIIINTIAPIQFLYASRQDTEVLRERALQLLEEVPAEENKIIRIWQENGWDVVNGAQSQALLQLYNNYCSSKRCLECTIGHNILRQA
ncbi:MAG: DUF2851 family protein [Chitinophagaceae bacterium]|nr:DUF2851 family protein [Chitinophagaceae bacterium]